MKIIHVCYWKECSQLDYKFRMLALEINLFIGDTGTAVAVGWLLPPIMHFIIIVSNNHKT